MTKKKLDMQRKTTSQFLTIFHILLASITFLTLFLAIGKISWQNPSFFRSVYLGGMMMILLGFLLLALASLFNKNLKEYQSTQLNKLASEHRTALIVAGICLFFASGAGAIAVFAFSPLAQVSLIAANATKIFGSWLAVLLTTMSWLIFCVGLALQSAAVELQKSIAYWLRAGVWACLPILGTLVLVGMRYNITPLAYRPFNGDDMFYWHQAKTFSQVGFGGGYYTYYERPAKALFTHFGNQGPIYPLIYGSLGALFGWHTYSAILYNHLLLAAAFLVFIRIARLPQNKLWLAGLSSGLFAPLLFYAGTSWYESFNHSLAIFMAAIMGILLRQGTKTKIYTRLLFIGVGFFCAATRASWAMLMVPLTFLCLSEMSIWRRLMLTVSGGGVLAIGAYRLWSYMASPYISFLPFSGQEETGEPINNLIARYFIAASENIRYLSSQPFFSSETLLSLSALGLISISIFIIIKKILHLFRKNSTFAQELPDIFEFTFHIFNISVSFVIVLLIASFGGGRFVRYMGVSLLISIFFLLAQGRYKIALVFIMFNLVGLPSLIKQYTTFHFYNYQGYYEESVFEELRAVAEEYIIYQPSSNGWCNSLLLEDDQQPFMVIPAGIGLAVKFEDENNWKYRLPLQSRYLILDRDPPGDNWAWLAKTPFGDLYLNTLTECPPLPYQ